MLGLQRSLPHVVFIDRGQFLLGRLYLRSAGAAVEADLGYVHVVDNSLIIDVGYVDAAEVVDRAVVTEDAAAPEASAIAHAAIAEAVIDAAVEADVRPPVSRIPEIDA